MGSFVDTEDSAERVPYIPEGLEDESMGIEDAAESHRDGGLIFLSPFKRDWWMTSEGWADRGFNQIPEGIKVYYPLQQCLQRQLTHSLSRARNRT